MGVLRRSRPGIDGPPLRPGTATPRIAIIGSGFGGLGMGIRLRQAGVESFTIYEKADSLGGTWRDNTYPGAGCDIPSHLYSFSFAPNPRWTRKFPEQPEILEYLEACADRFGLRRHLRFGVEVTGAAFDDDARTWTVRFADGTTDEVDVLVAATGQLNRPHVPALPGLDSFEGHAFHSARWDHDADLSGDVAVIGIGASAIQFVPAIADQPRRLTLFQRSVNYVAPKPDGPLSPRAHWLFEHVPPLERLNRAATWARFELTHLWFAQTSRSGRFVEQQLKKAYEQQVSDKLPREALVPDYPLGCKRLLISNDWYPTLHRDNVEVVTAGIDRIEPDAVVAGGVRHPADTIIFGTGFQSTGFLAPIAITGAGGRDLHTEWEHGAEAHLGMTVAGFPNLFVLYGPNTNLGHNSIVFMLERQISYVLQCVDHLVEGGLATLDVKPSAMDRSNRRLERDLAKTVWAAGCHSWYKDDTGKIVNNWPSSTIAYARRTWRPRWDEFIAARRG